MSSMHLLGFLLSVYNVQALRFFKGSAADASDTMYHLHIPKCAGASFKKDVQEVLPHTHLNGNEGCYEGHKNRMITLLRDPRPHVLSQYFHCRTSTDHKYGEQFVPATFPEWIDFWSDHFTEVEQFEQTPFCCYNPSNMMAAILSCGGDISKKQAGFHPASMQVLKEHIANLSFVGIVEAYQESLCLLRIQETGTFPEECECATKQDVTKQDVFNHHVKQHKVSDYSKDVMEKVDKLTAIDRELYEFGKKRFFDEIQAAEDKYQKKILCRKVEFNALTEHDLNDNDPLDSPMGNMNLASGIDSCHKWEEEAQQLGFALPSKSE